ncbi:MAG TPA: hypothetical protein PLK34_02475 [Candidatus Pacearchaeota archaeon]|nr:hypothetical protein [Candidatus Pacearchaeota archaeon]
MKKSVLEESIAEESQVDSQKNYFKKEYFKQIIPNSVILVPDEISLLKIQSYLMRNKQALLTPKQDFFSVIKSYKPEEITPEVLKKVDKLYDKLRRVTIEAKDSFLGYPEEFILSLKYSHPFVKDAHLRLSAPFDFPDQTYKTNTIIPAYVEEIYEYSPQIILARAPFNHKITLTTFNEPLTLEFLTTF